VEGHSEQDYSVAIQPDILDNNWNGTFIAYRANLKSFADLSNVSVAKSNTLQSAPFDPQFQRVDESGSDVFRTFREHSGSSN
jgi:hypothetical protein